MLKYTFLCYILMIGGALIYSQTVTNVRVVDHTSYILRVMRETIRRVEEMGWCNLKVPDYYDYFSETVFDWHLSGTVTYKNGFVLSIQNLDIVKQTVQQVWRFNVNGDNTTTVNLQGRLRMHDVVLGFDVDFLSYEQTQHYTATFKHNIIHFDFNIIKNAHTDELTVLVELQNLPVNRNKVIFMPDNNVTNILSATYPKNETFYGISDWGRNVFAPILLNVVTAEVEFPRLCYNCNT